MPGFIIGEGVECSLMMVTDELLFTWALQGDWQALTELVERYQSPLTRFSFRMTGGNTQLAEDLVQETFLRLVAYRGKLPACFKPWVFTITRNLIYDAFRSAAYRKEYQNDDETLQNTDTGINPADHDQEDVVGALQRLPLPQREVLVLRFYHELTLDEIAEITHAPLGTVKSRLFHALKQMKRLLIGNEEVIAYA
jgi:RNA polymerase sigma-70 factor, ECF subfamily